MRAGRTAGTETGLVTFVHRFDSALNLSVHLHILAAEGVHTFAGERSHFHRVPLHTDEALKCLIESRRHCTRSCGRWMFRSVAHSMLTSTSRPALPSAGSSSWFLTCTAGTRSLRRLAEPGPRATATRSRS